jgi:hypothetical protein
MCVPWNTVKNYVGHRADDANSVNNGKMNSSFTLSIISEFRLVKFAIQMEDEICGLIVYHCTFKHTLYIILTLFKIINTTGVSGT